ncbi:MFS transporter [Halorarius halobius]|uniref:MFS transporter n=1 Tax=Halorarius halobius TaxID=2962671 RepID=UPI0020CBAAEC|nr:MFS transporter [Halorarius halobius]
MAATSQGGVPWRSRTVQVVLASTALAPLGVPLVAPALPVVRDAFGVTDARASLLVSAYFLVGIVVSPFIGVLADRLGRKRVLVGSLALFGVAGGATAFAPAFWVVLVLRAIAGTAAAGIFVTTVTVIGDAFEGVQRNAVLGVNIAVLSAGAALFPVVGGALATVSWNVPFLTYLLAVPLAVVAAALLEEPTRERPPRTVGYLRGAARTVATPATLGLYAAAFLTELLLFGAVLTTLPFLLPAEFGLGPVAVGLVITVTEAVAVVVASLNGRFARRMSNGRLVAAGFACYAVGLAAAWLAPTAATVAAGMAVVGAGLGLSMPSVDAEMSERVAGRFRAGALSLRNSTTFLGRALGPVLFAGVALTTGYRPLLLAGGVAAGAAALVAFAVTGRRRMTSASRETW